MPLDVGGQPVGCVVTAGAILLEALHHDPVQVALKLMGRPRGDFDLLSAARLLEQAFDFVGQTPRDPYIAHA